ncbi:MAG TPA: hypothetical protein VK985_09405 [Rariglobus sp.]|nr:hypothetical protein [Rariglobus sp.]
MNLDQNGMYHAEKTKWQKACRALGRPCDDAALRALHKKVGAPHSSTKFSQDDLTHVIGEFKAISAMGDFNAQIKAQGTLKERLLAQAETLAAECGIRDGIDGLTIYFKRWLCGVPVARLDEATLGKLVGILQARKAQLPAKPQLAPAPTPAPAPEVPADPDFDPDQPFG